MVSERAARIQPSPTLTMTARANAMKAEGIDVISFGAGEPDFDTPQNVKDAAIRALESGFTKYTATPGMIELRKAICEKLEKDNGLIYTPAQIVVGDGAKFSLFSAVLALCNPGDEVIIPVPYWVTYTEQVGMAEGVPVFIETDESTGFKITAQMLKAAVTPKTKLLILNSPNNPTGAVYSSAELEAIAQVAVEEDFYVISDEIYEKIVYDGNRHVSIASFGEEIKKRTVVVNGLSKSHSMTGWRLGYAAGETEIISAMSRIQDHSTSNAVSFVQKGAVEALCGPQDFVEMMRHEFDERRKVMVAGLNAIPGIVCPDPGGAFYVFPNVSGLYGQSFKGKTIDGSKAFAEFLLDEVKVSLVPGSGFGADRNVRLSYATSMANIKKGLERIADAVSRLKG